MRKTPVIDMSECTDCGSCTELCPTIFRRNEDTGHIEMVNLLEYFDENIQEAMSMCPADCISWEEIP